MKTDYLTKGDILLVSYKLCPLSKIIQLFLHCKWNHAAWIYDENYIIEVKRYGVCLRPIKKYYNKFLFDIKIVKPIYTSAFDPAIAECFLLEQTCKSSYIKLFISFLYLAFNINKKFPRPTCSGFIAEALTTVGFKFNNKAAYLITPADINNSKYIEVFYE